jgi:hypothetical protein
MLFELTLPGTVGPQRPRMTFDHFASDMALTSGSLRQSEEPICPRKTHLAPQPTSGEPSRLRAETHCMALERECTPVTLPPGATKMPGNQI